MHVPNLEKIPEKMLLVILYLIGVTPWKLGRNKFFGPGHPDKFSVEAK
jgi:hypothetical protein